MEAAIVNGRDVVVQIKHLLKHVLAGMQDDTPKGQNTSAGRSTASSADVSAASDASVSNNPSTDTQNPAVPTAEEVTPLSILKGTLQSLQATVLDGVVRKLQGRRKLEMDSKQVAQSSIGKSNGAKPSKEEMKEQKRLAADRVACYKDIAKILKALNAHLAKYTKPQGCFAGAPKDVDVLVFPTEVKQWNDMLLVEVDRLDKLLAADANHTHITMPFDPATRPFFGRGKLLKSMQETIDADTNQTTLLLLTGASGHGKSALALHFSTRYLAHEAFWLDAEDPFVLLEGLRLLALNTSAMDEADAKSADLRTVVRHLEKDMLDKLKCDKRGWIVILDNVSDANDVAECLFNNTVSRGTVILTTKNTKLEIPGAKVIEVPLMLPEEAPEVVRVASHDTVEAIDVEDLAHEYLHNYPLALVIAGATFNAHRSVTIDQYASKLDSRDMVGKAIYTTLIFRQLDILLRVLGGNDLLKFVDLFFTLSAFSNNRIPIAWLFGKHGDGFDPAYTQLAFQMLEHSYLITRSLDGMFFSMDRSLRDAAQSNALNFCSWTVFPVKAARIIQLNWQFEFNRGTETWREASKTAHHANVVATRLKGSVEADVVIAQPVAALFQRVAAFYHFTGIFLDHAETMYLECVRVTKVAFGPESLELGIALNGLALLNAKNGVYQALTYFQQSLELHQKPRGKDHVDVAAIHSHMGSFHAQKNEFTEALQHYEQALKIYEKSTGAESEMVATLLNYMGNIHKPLGQNDVAIAMYNRALAIHEKLASADTTNIAMTLNNLAAAYDGKGEHETALPLYARARKLTEKSYGPNHPNVAISLANMARVYEAHEQYEHAIKFYDKALTVRKNHFGEESTEVATTVNCIANIQRLAGDETKALNLYHKSLSILEKVNNNKPHVEIATTLHMIASVYDLKHEYDTALEYFSRSLAMRELLLGADHPLVATTLCDIAAVHISKKDVAKGMELYQRALRIQRSILEALGKNASITTAAVALTLGHIAQAHASLGELDKAIEGYSEAVKILEELPLPAQENLGTMLNNMAQVHIAKKEFDIAMKLYERDIEITTRILGPDHPSLATTVFNVGVIFDTQSDYERALQFYLQALRIRERSHGVGHVSVAVTLTAIGQLYDKVDDTENASKIYEQAIEIYEKAVGVNSADLIVPVHGLGMCRLKGDKDHVKALPLLERAHALTTTAGLPLSGDVVYTLASCNALNGQNDRAIELYLSALSLQEASLGPNHPFLSPVLVDLAAVYMTKGEGAKAKPLMDRAREIQDAAAAGTAAS